MLLKSNQIDNTPQSPEINKLFNELRIGREAIQNGEVYSVEDAFAKIRSTLEKELKERGV